MKSSKDINKKRKLIDIERRRRYGISYSFKKLIEDEQNKLKDTDANKYASRIEYKTKKSTKKVAKKYLISNLLMESEKQELIKLYGDDDKVKHQILPLLNFTKISDCSIMKYGARKSAIEIEYSYCKTCDYNSLKPICLTCINKCHYGHVIKFILKKGHIKCSCGEKNHMIMKINYKKIYNMNCLFNEWNSTANLKYYYTNKNKEPICILCEYCCSYDRMKNNIIKLKKNKTMPNCSCKNKDIHNDKRTICEKLLNLISSANDYNFLLHPVQFVNMIFKSKNNFKYIFEYFDFFISDLNNSRENSHIIELLSKMRRIDIEYTNIYKSLIIFEKIVEKTGKNNIHFYHKEVTDYFSFNLVKKLLEILMESTIEEKLFYQLSNKFLYLFHKTYLNEKTKLLNKFKLTDLKHLNYITRIDIYKQNQKNFIESQPIISFLIDFITYINNKRPLLIEAIHCIKEIASIFRKLSCYNLINNHDMVKICKNIADSFNWIWNIKLFILKNDQKDIKSKIDSYYFNNISIKGFYIIIKTLQNFIYNYNDNIIDIIINNKKKYPNYNDIKIDNICFIFKKNELGELINKLSIYILSILETTYKKVVNKRILLIKRLSVQIIQYGLNEDDIYMLNIVDSIYKFKSNDNLENNIYYNEFKQQTDIILNSFNQYFNFEIIIEETLNIINNSLNLFLDEKDIQNIETINVDDKIHKFNSEQKVAIFYSNFFYLIYKIIGIINNHQKRKKECEKKERFKNLNDLIDAIPPSLEDIIYKKLIYFSFAFVADSADCSFLILSHYIFKELIKMPGKYCHILFKLFHLCFKNIFESENNTIKMDSSFLIKRLYNYLEELMNNKDLKNDNNVLIKCIDEFLQILEIATLNCEYSLFNIFIYKIQYLIIMVQKKYNLVQKYFDIEIKENSSNINNDETYIITKIFSSYMKLINNCFDMSIEEDRKKVKEIINIDDIINALKNNNCNINIDLKTEFLRFIRKSMIDLKYSSSENNQYTKAIINNKDNLEELKENSLLSYSNYPTKLLSFMKDFYSITANISLKEKIEDKKNEKVKTQVVKRNSNIRNWVIEKKGNRDLNLSHEISDLGETKLEISGFFEEYKNNTPHHNSNIDNDTVYQNVKFSNYLENEHKINHISRSTNISKLLSHTEVYRNKSNKLITIIPREKKKIMNNYLFFEENMIEKEIDKKDIKLLKDIIKENNNQKLYYKSKELNILEDAFNRKFFYIINKEIDDIFQKNWKLDNDEILNSFRNYIENGILIPVIFYFKKIMIMVEAFTGYEMILLFSLFEKCLKLKIYLYENKNIWMKEKKSNNKFILFQKCNMFNISSNNKNISMIDYTKFQSNENYQLTKESLNIINGKKISVYDYSILYQLLEKELFSLIKERKIYVFNYKNNKDKYKDELGINKIIHDYENLFKKDKKDFILSEKQRRLIKTLIIYKNSKIIYNNENNSSILSILSEINLEFEINFRNLLISSLINHSKDLNAKNEFLTISYYLLFKLLLLQTEETQSEIINIINKKEINNPDFIKDLSKILYNKIILTIIEYLNPSDKLIYSNYLISCYLLWIFTFLCAKENKIFKLKFIRELSYKYISNIFNFFRDNQVIHNNIILEKSLFESSVYGDNNFIEDKNKTSLDKNGKEINKENTYIQIIKFYDFLLLLIPKICLISNWDKIQKLPQDNFLYDLFSSIIDLLSEIINGKKCELLSILFDDIITTKVGGNYEKTKKIESFQDFLKEISYILIDKKNNKELNIQVKQKLIDYINSIIEEKDCDETIQKTIEKYLNINNIYKNISIIMKIYFIKNMKPKNEEKPQKKKTANPGKKKNSTTYFPFEKNLTYDKKSNFLNERKNKRNYEENSTSKNKILNLMVDANIDLKKNLFAIKMKENAQNKKINGENKTFRSFDNKFDPEMKLFSLTFGKHLYEYFINEFNYNIKFMECSDFKLCNSFYKYIKFIKLKKEDYDQYEMDNIIKMYYKEEDININNKEENFEDLYCSNSIDNEHISQAEKDYIERYFIEKFFEGIISTIEIINQNKKNKMILFTKFPLMKYITYQTKYEFRENVNRDSEFSKKYDLIKYIEYFIEEINYNKKNKIKFNFLTKINFHYLPQLSYYLAVFHNLFFLFTMKGDNQISISESLMFRIKDKNKIEQLINKSANEWDNIYLIFCIIYIIINASFIFVWMMINLPLYYKINKADYLKMRKKKNKKMGIFDKIYITLIILLLKGDYILPLIYEFFLSLICIFSNERKIIFPFLLIPILYINKTLRNIIVSIRLNFYPFTLTFFCAFILMFVLSNIYFFFFNPDFEKEINYYQDNCCKTLAFAFLNALDNGLRARGGMGDSAKRISFKRDRDHYILRLILDDIFFFFIVIIMIDLVFGIVLRSFDKLQHRNYKYDLDKRKHCFICNSKKESLEKDRINFYEHVNIKHNVWNYIEYMIKIKLKEENNLNQVNDYVLDKINKRDISWLPTHKELKYDNIKDNNSSEDKNIIILNENFPNYKIRQGNY